ncbi:hypothetical protein GCM10022293_25920 [Azospirillum formosense]
MRLNVCIDFVVASIYDLAVILRFLQLRNALTANLRSPTPCVVTWKCMVNLELIGFGPWLCGMAQ